MTRRTLLLVALAAACGEPAPEEAVHVTGPCEAPVPWADLAPEVGETSGIAASRDHAGVFWSHNDSGGDSAVFALDSTGVVTARVRVRGAANHDWEDISVAPCEPGGAEDCLFLADTGDNRERREHVTIFRVAEPNPRTDTVTPPADRLDLTYPTGPRDAEALFVTDAGLHIVTKGRSAAIELYRLAPPYEPRTTRELEQIQDLAPPPTSISAQVTGAAFSDQTGLVVLRTYSGLRFFAAHADSLRQVGDPADFLGPAQPLGEGVDFIAGDRLVLTGEAGGRQPATIATIRCDPLRPPPLDSTPAS